MIKRIETKSGNFIVNDFARVIYYVDVKGKVLGEATKEKWQEATDTWAFPTLVGGPSFHFDRTRPTGEIVAKTESFDFGVISGSRVFLCDDTGTIGHIHCVGDMEQPWSFVFENYWKAFQYGEHHTITLATNGQVAVHLLKPIKGQDWGSNDRPTSMQEAIEMITYYLAENRKQALNGSYPLEFRDVMVKMGMYSK